MCKHCHDGTVNVEEVAELLALVDIGEDCGLHVVRAPEDVLSMPWLMQHEIALMKELRPQVVPMGQAFYDELIVMVDEVDWETVSEIDAKAMLVTMRKRIHQAGEAFATTATPIVGAHTSTVYESARTLMSSAPEMSFDLLDTRAIDWIKQDPKWWIQNHYGPELSTQIQGIVEKGLTDAVGRKELAARLEKKLAAEFTDYRYWDVLSSANLNRSRSWGAMRTLHEQGVEKVVWVAIGDERMCFEAGTPVSTPDGDVPIESLVNGDMVSTPEGPRKVTATMAHEHEGARVMVVTNRGSAVSTPDHPYLVGSDWVDANDLVPGCLLHATNGRQHHVVEVNIIQGQRATVYDITVDEQEVFYAAGSLVHNCPTCGALDGTVFKTGRAVDSMRQIVEGEMRPDEYADAAPWISVAGNDEKGFTWSYKSSSGQRVDVTDLFSGMKEGRADDGAGLQDIGVNAPPVHGRCRCTLDPVV